MPFLFMRLSILCIVMYGVIIFILLMLYEKGGKAMLVQDSPSFQDTVYF